MKRKISLIAALLLVATLILSGCSLFEKEVTYTVTLDANGGELSGESSLTVAEQSMVDLPSPKREGYVFLGWYLGEGANEAKFTSTDLVTSDITLKAKWMSEEDVNGGVKIEIHTVTLNANGGTLPGDSVINAQTYSTLNLPTPTMEGYVFLGWYVGEGVNESIFTSSSLVTSDLTLNAKWAKADHTVTFLDYYGNVISREGVKHGEAAVGPTVPRIAEECLRFDAWDTDISCITADIEVKALYVLDAYTITYVTNNSQTIPTTSYFFGETPVAPPSPGLGGHYFIGWYLDEEFTEEYKFDAPLTENITLYAYFNESIPISTLEELLAIPEYSNANYFLKNDIDCDGAVITTSIVGFAGVLDGCDHKIYNFVYTPAGAADTGLFATNGGTIKNIYFDDFSYTLTNTNLNSNVGFLVGTNNGTLDNIHITDASLSYTHTRSGGGSNTSYYGAIAGANNGSISNCTVVNGSIYLRAYSSSWWDSGHVTSTLNCATVTGINSGSIKNCASNTTVTLRNQNDGTSSHSGNSSYLGFGGLVSVNNGSITECNAVINATGSANNNRTRDCYVGGLVYINNKDAAIEKCSSELTLALNGSYSYASVGGFVENNIGNVKYCYSKVNITNSDSNTRFGGFVSQNTGGIYKCYSAGEMNVGAATVGKGGFAGYNNGSINASFAAVNTTTTDATRFGPFLGNADTASLITNCYYNIKGIFITSGSPQTFDVTYASVADHLNLTDSDWLTANLGWSADQWEFDANKFNYPTLK